MNAKGEKKKVQRPGYLHIYQNLKKSTTTRKEILHFAVHLTTNASDKARQRTTSPQYQIRNMRHFQEQLLAFKVFTSLFTPSSHRNLNPAIVFSLKLTRGLCSHASKSSGGGPGGSRRGKMRTEERRKQKEPKGMKGWPGKRKES